MRKRRQHISKKALKDVGDRIRTLRVERMLSQERLAEECGVHRTYITEIENGLRNISLLTLFALADGLEVKACVILHCLETHER
jgi:transcriptional regulator with XRE-family HTH domain